MTTQSEGSLENKSRVFAKAASKLFAVSIPESNVVVETLERITEPTVTRPARTEWIAEMRGAVTSHCVGFLFKQRLKHGRRRPAGNWKDRGEDQMPLNAQKGKREWPLPHEASEAIPSVQSQT